jgi:hypothetical protein
MREIPANHHPLVPFSQALPRIFEPERPRLRPLTSANLALIFETYTGEPLATKRMAWLRYAKPDDVPFLEAVDVSFSGTPTDPAQFCWLVTLKTNGEANGGCGRAKWVRLGSARGAGRGILRE